MCVAFRRRRTDERSSSQLSLLHLFILTHDGLAVGKDTPAAFSPTQTHHSPSGRRCNTPLKGFFSRLLCLRFVWHRFSGLSTASLYFALNVFICSTTEEENNTLHLSYFPTPSAAGGGPGPPAGPIRRVLIGVCRLSVPHCSKIGRRAAGPSDTDASQRGRGPGNLNVIR